ncbi:Salicylate carboxymethyltransferase, partial [Bienertia sinuspersici]
IIEEEKLNAFNLPQYTPSATELGLIIEKEGSFTLDQTHESEVNGEANENQKNKLVNHYDFVKCMTSVAEPLLVSHFGDAIIEELFDKYMDENVLCQICLTIIFGQIALVEYCFPLVRSFFPSVESYFPSVESYFRSIGSYFPSVGLCFSLVGYCFPLVVSYFPSIESCFPSVGFYFPSVESYFPSVESYFPSVESCFPSFGSYFPSFESCFPSVDPIKTKRIQLKLKKKKPN